jgi:RNA-directed DNA polymerase
MANKSLRVLFDSVHHGKYDFEDFLYGFVESSYDSIIVRGRPVYRPDKKLKAYHAFINAFVCEFLDVNERVVFSYRKGVNPHAAVVPHAGNRAFFQTDIANFFGSVDREMVSSTLATRSTRVPVADLAEYTERILDLTTTIEGTLPVGFSTSPPISNSCLAGFDNELETYCGTNALTYTRYSDDLLVSAKAREQLAGIEAVICRMLKAHFSNRLQLNPAKSKFTSVGRKVKMLGMVVLPTGQVTIDGELKKRIEVLLHFYLRDREKFLDLVDNDLKGGIEQLSGYINYLNAADGHYLEKIRRKFGAAVIDSFVHKSAS